MSAILTPIHSVIAPTIGTPLILPWMGGGLIYPPVLDKLLAWHPGTLEAGFTYVQATNALGEFEFDALGNPSMEISGTGTFRKDSALSLGNFPLLITPGVDPVTDEWDGADATYSYGVIGEPAPPLINTQDQLESRFWTDSNGNNIGKTQAEIEAYVVGLAAEFFCIEHLMYTEQLTGSELAKVQAYIAALGCL